MSETASAPEMIQVPKSELDTLRSIQTLMDKTWKNKETGSQFRALLKKIDPNLAVPEDVADSVVQPVAAKADEAVTKVTEFGARLDKFLQESKDEKDTTTLRTEIAAAQKKFGLDDEGVTKLMQRMKDKNNPDVESAAAWVVSQQPKPQPITDHGISSVNANLFGSTKADDNYKDLQTGGDPFRPGGWFDREANKILNEPVDQAA